MTYRASARRKPYARPAVAPIGLLCCSEVIGCSDKPQALWLRLVAKQRGHNAATGKCHTCRGEQRSLSYALLTITGLVLLAVILLAYGLAR